MVIVMEESATEGQVSDVIDRLVALGFDAYRITGAKLRILGAVGVKIIDTRDIELMPGVREVVRITTPYKLASRAFNPGGTQIKIKDVIIGGREVVVMAGPSAVESRDQIFETAQAVRSAGARVLRGGAFKTPSATSSFSGLGHKGLEYLRQAADRFGMLVVSEITDAAELPALLDHVDIIQVGARNIENAGLLRAVGRTDMPVMLKRSPAATLEETLLAAETVMAEGNPRVMVCERGIRTFEPYLKSTFDISAIPVLKKLSHLPVVADPSRATGRRDKVAPLAQAAVAAGVDALLIEVHNDPENALCDGAQSLRPEQFGALMARLRLIAEAIDRAVAGGGGAAV